MLNRTTLELVAPTAAALANRGYLATSAPHSPLAALNQASIDSIRGIALSDDASSDQSKRIEQAITDLSENTAPTMGLTSIKDSPHGRLFSLQVKELSERIGRLMRFIPESVTPMIRELVNSVNDDLSKITPDEVLGVKIRVLPYPGFLTNNSTASTLSRYRAIGSNNEAMVLRAIVDPSDPETWVSRMKTGSATVDAELTKWFDQVGTDRVAEVANTVFATKGDGDKRLRQLVNDPENGLYNTTVIYYLSVYLMGNDVTYREAVSDARGYLRVIQNITGGRLYRYLVTTLKHRDDKRVVSSYENNTVTVFEDTYTDFIEEGGTNEMLQGALFASDRRYSGSAILEKGMEYTRIWQERLTVLQATWEERRRGITKKLLQEHFLRIVTDGGYEQPELLLRRFNQSYNALKLIERSDLQVAATVAVCESCFPDSPAQKVLLEMNNIMRSRSDIDAESASSLAFSLLIADWVADLVLVNKIGA